MLVRVQLERNSKMKALLPSNIFSGSSDKSNGKEQGCIKAGPMTKALTLQFMNGFRAHPHFGGKAHTSSSVGVRSRSSRARGESGLLPDRTQGAGVSRRLAGEVCWLA